MGNAAQFFGISLCDGLDVCRILHVAGYQGVSNEFLACDEMT